jgi:hypothetical protein
MVSLYVLPCCVFEEKNQAHGLHLLYFKFFYPHFMEKICHLFFHFFQRFFFINNIELPATYKKITFVEVGDSE